MQNENKRLVILGRKPYSRGKTIWSIMSTLNLFFKGKKILIYTSNKERTIMEYNKVLKDIYGTNNEIELKLEDNNLYRLLWKKSNGSEVNKESI